MPRTKLSPAAERWRKILAECKASGKTQTEFCAERGLRADSLTHWKRRLEGSSRAGKEADEFVELPRTRAANPVFELSMDENWRVNLRLSFDLSAVVQSGAQ